MEQQTACSAPEGLLECRLPENGQDHPGRLWLGRVPHGHHQPVHKPNEQEPAVDDEG
jgi:hypothetical protein